MKRITKNEFFKLKEQLLSIERDDSNFLFFAKPIYQELFSYDLSAIDYESFHGMRLQLTNFNLSNSRPNIDFSLLDKESYFENVNFKNCSIKNLDKGSFYFRNLSPHFFTSEIIFQYPDFFLTEDVPSSVKNHFQRGEISIEEYREYHAILKKKNVHFMIRCNDSMKQKITLFGNLDNYIRLVDKELDHLVLLNHPVVDFCDIISTEEELELFLKNHKYKQFNLTIKQIYALSKYISLEDILGETSSCLEMIYKFGIENIMQFNSIYGDRIDEKFLDFICDYDRAFIYNVGHFSKDICNKEIIEKFKLYSDCSSIDNYDMFYDYLGTLVDYMRMNVRNDCILNLFSLADAYPNKVLSRDEYHKICAILDTDSFKDFYCYNPLKMFKKVKNNEEIKNILKEKQIIYSSNYEDLYALYTSDELFEIFSNYNMVIHYIVENYMEKINNTLDIYECFDHLVYQLLINEEGECFDFRTLPKSFRKKYPELFINTSNKKDEDAFYLGKIDGEYLKNHPYLKKDLINVNLPCCLAVNRMDPPHNESIYKVLGRVMTNEDILDLMIMYGQAFDCLGCYIEIDPSCNKDIVFSKFESLVFEYIKVVWYGKNDFPETFKKKYSAFYLDESAPSSLIKLYDEKKLSFYDLYLHPEWIEFLKDKSLEGFSNYMAFLLQKLSVLNVSKEELLGIVSKYGVYLEFNNEQCIPKGNMRIHDYEQFLLETMYQKIKNKELILKNHYDVVSLLKEKHPMIVIDSTSPENLKKLCYNSMLKFSDLKEHPAYIPFIQNKNWRYFMMFDCTSLIKKLGKQKALYFGIKKAEVIDEMLERDKCDLLLSWYEKLHFIPDSSVMLNMDINQSDKFTSASRKWSKIMKCLGKKNDYYAREALLKLALVFGVFDGDNKGYQSLMQLVFGLPKKMDVSCYNGLLNHFNNGMYKEDTSRKLYNILQEIYSLGKNGDYYLKNMDVSDSKVCLLREAISNFDSELVFKKENLHPFFGGMDTKYNPKFRDFIVCEIDSFIEENKTNLISVVERQLKKIMSFNKNRKLDFNTVIDYVDSIQYSNIEVGNAALASLASRVGYDENDFNQLQKIYKYTKYRISSSIPRIVGEYLDYSYEILRLDDPLALVIGELTNCCQRLNDAAESSMIHSATDENGRVFVVRDKSGNIVAQSWVWRKKNTICFDNIEIPDKAFKGHEDREMFSNIILSVYQEASKKFLEYENKNSYISYYEENKNHISEEEIDKDFGLSMVTVGLGFNDIAEVIDEKLSMVDKAYEPDCYVSPIDQNEYLYLDSEVQYLLCGKEKQYTLSSTLPIYSDDLKVYSSEMPLLDSDKLLLEDLCYDTSFSDSISIESIADYYDMDINHVKILMNYNFAFIYEELEEEIHIKEIFYDLFIEEDFKDCLYKQIRLAYKQLNETNKIISLEEISDTSIKDYLIKEENHKKLIKQ